MKLQMLKVKVYSILNNINRNLTVFSLLMIALHWVRLGLVRLIGMDECKTEMKILLSSDIRFKISERVNIVTEFCGGTPTYRPLLWSRGNVVASHPVGPGSNPGRVGVFPGFSLNCKTNVRIFKLHLCPDTIWPS